MRLPPLAVVKLFRISNLSIDNQTENSILISNYRFLTLKI